MADYGVRKYDSFTGRFMTADVLFEKYPAWNPYHYSVNNPITFRDGNGYVVIAKDTDVQNSIRNTVPEYYHDYISFDDNGVLNQDLISQVGIISSDINMSALYDVATHKEIVEIEITNELNYKDGLTDKPIPPASYFENGVAGTTSFTKENYTEKRHKEKGFYYSIKPNTYIQLRNGLSQNALSKTVSAELYGHFHSFILGVPFLHTEDYGGKNDDVYFKENKHIDKTSQNLQENK